MLAGITQGVKDVGVTAGVHGFWAHSLRTIVATDASAHGADITKVWEWLGHANTSITRMYDHLINPFRIG